MAAPDLARTFALHTTALLPDAGTTLLVAVSGGADSVALLHLLVGLGRHRLAVFHLDHGLREESPRDARWVEQLCATLGCACISERADITALAQANGWGIEEAGREERYRRLALAAERIQASAVLTAHHRDDQVETVLMHLLRGSGLTGARGLRALRPLGSIALIRPLLEVSRQQLRDFLQAQGHTWRDDASNDDLRLRRNRCRHRVLPLCEQAEPGFAAALIAWSGGQGLQESPASTAARDSLQRHGVALSRARIRRVMDLTRGETGRALHVGQLLVRKLAQGLQWQDARDRIDPVPPVVIPGAGSCIRGEHALLVRLRPAPQGAQLRLVGPQAMIAAQAVRWPLIWRTLAAGDRWQQLGASGSQAVLKTLSARKLPAHQRHSVSVLCDQLGIVWIPGVGVCERARVEAYHQQVVQVWIMGSSGTRPDRGRGSHPDPA